MSTLTETFYLTYDNRFALVVKEGVSAIDLVATGVTRVVLKFAGYAADSNDAQFGQGCFDWTTDGRDGIIQFDFGELNIVPGRHKAYLIIYDPSHPDGQVWPYFWLIAKKIV